ncbi:hypothetical protein KIPB_006394 [Kipferlia bialata]|uniref:Uncharacterized protein n=1 Tax=Kipferlia bialata TaxID=797122 RepID=A0A9K3GI57_9EUKA|nr:hypothetical protein KIPB_006394 [Kipferlia bialata]|eukprot:g6394.t1
MARLAGAPKIEPVTTLPPCVQTPPSAGVNTLGGGTPVAEGYIVSQSSQQALQESLSQSAASGTSLDHDSVSGMSLGERQVSMEVLQLEREREVDEAQLQSSLPLDISMLEDVDTVDVEDEREEEDALNLRERGARRSRGTRGNRGVAPAAQSGIIHVYGKAPPSAHSYRPDALPHNSPSPVLSPQPPQGSGVRQAAKSQNQSHSLPGPRMSSLFPETFASQTLGDTDMSLNGDIERERDTDVREARSHSDGYTYQHSMPVHPQREREREREGEKETRPRSLSSSFTCLPPSAIQPLSAPSRPKRLVVRTTKPLAATSSVPVFTPPAQSSQSLTSTVIVGWERSLTSPVGKLSQKGTSPSSLPNRVPTASTSPLSPTQCSLSVRRKGVHVRRHSLLSGIGKRSHSQDNLLDLVVPMADSDTPQVGSLV